MTLYANVDHERLDDLIEYAESLGFVLLRYQTEATNEDYPRVNLSLRQGVRPNDTALFPPSNEVAKPDVPMQGPCSEWPRGPLGMGAEFLRNDVKAAHHRLFGTR